MIVVDTNIITYLYLPTDYTKKAEDLLIEEPIWVAPILWRSEFRNILALYIRKRILAFEQAVQIQAEAESLMENNEYQVNSLDILNLIQNSSCSAYDCEFVALANSLKTKLVTADKKIISEFPNTAATIESALDER